MTEESVNTLNAACGHLSEPGERLSTSKEANCADAIWSIYSTGKTLAGNPAFEGYDRRRLQPLYTWSAQLLAGLLPNELDQIASNARSEALANPVGATQSVGSFDNVAHFARYYEQMVDLISALTTNGFDTWIVSASAEPIVRIWASGVGISPDRVIGVRPLLSDHGTYSYDIESCGGLEQGSIMPYIEGKRCFVNKRVYGDNSEGALAQRPPSSRHVFAAGDSVTDITFLSDATELKLVVDRHNPELMCHAFHNDDGRWLVNPMFFDPLPDPKTAYPCSTTACVDKTRKPGPCRDESGNLIPDQNGQLVESVDDRGWSAVPLAILLAVVLLSPWILG